MKRIALALAAGLVFCTGSAAAQATWPAQPVKWIVPYPPGGSTDMLARLVSHKLGERLGQPVIVENKAGAGGNIGTDFAVKQPADGYTIVMGNIGPISINPALYPDLPYKPQRDLAPVTMLMSVPNLLVVNPALPVRSVQELIAYAKKSKAPLDYATPGAGTSLHLAGELFASSAGVRLTHVPYRGSAPGLNDTVAGHVPMMFDNMPSALQLVKAGKLRALAITSTARSPQLPDVPTMAEAGLPGYEIAGWFGVLAPAATPADVVGRLNAEMVKIIRSPDFSRRMAEIGAVPIGDTPAEMKARIGTDTENYAKLVKDAKVAIN